MSDIHVLTGDGIQRWTVVMHFPIPSASNGVGNNYRTVLVSSSLGGSTSMTTGSGVGQIPSAEVAQIEAGEVYEHAVSFLAESGGSSTAQMRTALRSEYAKEKSRMIAVLQKKLRYYGHTESGS